VVDSVAKPSAARLARTFPVALIQQGHDPARRVDEQIRERNSVNADDRRLFAAYRPFNQSGKGPIFLTNMPLLS